MFDKICPFISTPSDRCKCLGSECMLYDINECAVVKILDVIEKPKND